MKSSQYWLSDNHFKYRLGGTALGLLLLTGQLAVASTVELDENNSDVLAGVIALDVIDHANSLRAKASTRTHAETSSHWIGKTRIELELEVEVTRQKIARLSALGYDYDAIALQDLLDGLHTTSQKLEAGRSEIARILAESANRREELISVTSWDLLPAIYQSEDELFYQIVSNTDSGSKKAADVVSAESLLQFQRLALLTQQIDKSYILLEVATRLDDSQFIGTAEDHLSLVIYQLQETLKSFAEVEPEYLDPRLVPLAWDLVEAATGKDNLIDLMKSRLRLTDQEQQLVVEIVGFAEALESQAVSTLTKSIANLENRDDYPIEKVRALQAALAVRQHASDLKNDATAASSAGSLIPETSAIQERVEKSVSSLRDELEKYASTGYEFNLDALSTSVSLVESTLGDVLDNRPELIEALQYAARTRIRIRNLVNFDLTPLVVSSIDNQLYYMLTGRSEFRNGATDEASPLSQVEFMRLWHLTNLYKSVFRAFSGLTIAMIMDELTLIGEAEERFLTASHRLARSNDFLKQYGGPDIAPQLVAMNGKFIISGSGTVNVFDALRHRLPLIEAERTAIQMAQQTLQFELIAKADNLILNLLEST